MAEGRSRVLHNGISITSGRAKMIKRMSTTEMMVLSAYTKVAP